MLFVEFHKGDERIFVSCFDSPRLNEFRNGHTCQAMCSSKTDSPVPPTRLSNLNHGFIDGHIEKGQRITFGVLCYTVSSGTHATHDSKNVIAPISLLQPSYHADTFVYQFWQVTSQGSWNYGRRLCLCSWPQNRSIRHLHVLMLPALLVKIFITDEGHDDREPRGVRSRLFSNSCLKTAPPPLSEKRGKCSSLRSDGWPRFAAGLDYRDGPTWRCKEQSLLATRTWLVHCLPRYS